MENVVKNMDNVIEFPVRNTAAKLSDENKRKMAEAKANPPQNRFQYLKLCKNTLTMEDYVDLLCSILDEEIYDMVEPQIRGIVDAYYKFES